MEFLTEYGLFLAKSVTVLVVVAVIIGLVVSAGHRHKGDDSGTVEVTKLNDRYEQMQSEIRDAVISEEVRKQQLKAEKKQKKQEHKERQQALKKSKGESSDALDEVGHERQRVFVLDFDGDIKASEVTQLREEVSSVLSLATDKDEVVVKLESGGGMVHSYGLASSQLDRIRKKGIPLTVCVDKVAASGGYMMACVADKVLAAPFAIIGSLGVVAQLPNFHRLLQKHDIDFELLTAGEHKRTLTMFGENTDKGREKFVEDLEDTHQLFKDFVQRHRPVVDIDQVANGDVWFGERALEQKLVDELITSDEYLLDKISDADVFEVSYELKRSLPEKLGLAASTAVQASLFKGLSKLAGYKGF